MRPVLLLAVLATAAPAAASAAAAAPRPPPNADGFLLAVRAGWGVPLGDAVRDVALADVADGKLPLGVDVGYRFNGRLGGALYLELSPLSLALPCPTGSGCSGFDVRFGLVVQLHLAPRSWADPWVGAGFGVEHLEATAPTVPDAPVAWERSWFGLEVPVEAGLDLALSDYFALGPYASAAFGQFTSASTRPPGGATTTAAVGDRVRHGWVQAG